MHRTGSRTTAGDRRGAPVTPNARQLIDAIADTGSFEAWGDELRSVDRLGFRDRVSYVERLCRARHRSGVNEAFLAGALRVVGRPLAIGAYEYEFIGGGMGCVVGERIARLFRRAAAQELPVLVLHRSGGARMQEGTWSLMQMAKVCLAVSEHREAGLLYVSFLLDPCMGGALASSGALGDIVIAEPGARIGFAGERVTQATLGRRLPPDLQSAESLLRNGFVDRIVPAAELRSILARLVASPRRPVARAKSWPRSACVQTASDRHVAARARGARYQTIRASRSLYRPRFGSWSSALCSDFLELHGDRAGGDDPALRGGLARIGLWDVMLIGLDRGESVDELRRHNFAMASPFGYRKVARLVRLAERMKLPILTIIDTPGASPLAQAEKDGQAFAIAEATLALVSARTPTVGFVIGEGSSGGAIALAAVDRLLMLENTHLSVISPEGCAAILWRDRSYASDAADAHQSTARDLLVAGIADYVLQESGKLGRPLSELAQAAEALICGTLDELARVPATELLAQRRSRLHRDMQADR